MRHLFSKRALAAACLLLLALFVLRPQAGWIRGRLTSSLSRALGRNVQIGSVQLRFFPRPGFELHDLIVSDNPTFGAEPLLRAPDVMAALRLRSLIRGRTEIARLSLGESSLNLTRNTQGKWNIEDLLDRTSHSSMAPTGAKQRSAGPSFPYIEATDARVNFKIGAEKTHFALTNAEFALWQESEDTWGARLQARPIRTDANLTDTGTINISGLWRRSPEVHQTPLQISFQWKQAQIGQLSKLAYGEDKGWRGGVLLSASMLGTPEHLNITADASVEDFRRQDVFGGGDLRLAAHCFAIYKSAAREVSDLDCSAASGGGYLQLKGSAAGLLSNGQPFSAADLRLTVNRIPAETVVVAAAHLSMRFPRDLAATGTLSSTLQMSPDDSTGRISIQGSGTIDDLAIQRTGFDVPVELGTVPFAISNRSEEQAPTSNAKRIPPKSRSRVLFVKSDEQGSSVRVEFGPVSLSSSKNSPLIAQGTVDRNGYQAWARGEAGVNRLLQIARTIGIPAPAVVADGVASVNLNVSGSWAEAKPTVTGTARLRAVRAQLRGVNTPVEIVNADLSFDPEVISVQNLTLAALQTTWHGSVRIPRPCSSPITCQLQFKLKTAELSASSLNTTLNPAVRPRAWYRFLSIGNDQPSYLLQVRASGKVAIDKLTIGKSVASHFTSDLRLDTGMVSLSNFHGDILDGTATGDWQANFASKPPTYRGSGRFEDVALEQVAGLMDNAWVDGAGNANYEFTATGSSVQELLASADIGASFTARKTTFPRVVLTRETIPLQADEFSGNLRLSDDVFSFAEAKLARGNEVYTVSGTASMNGTLNLKAVAENSSGFSITGTLLKTRVSAIPNAEASLKP